MSARQGGYDSGYRSCPCFWGNEPSSLVMTLGRTLSDFTAANVVDIGCGEGKNAAFFARRGAFVTALDVSPWALEHARAEWASIHNINWILADACSYDLGIDTFDVVVAYGVFHCLSNASEIRRLQADLSVCTKVGGYHVVCTFNARQQDLRVAHPGFTPCLLTHQDYVDMYADWDLLVASDANLTEVHPHNGIEHTHSMTRILARKQGMDELAR